jgi:hypothetical protein
VIRCVASFKSENFEFEDELHQKIQITGQKSEKTLITFLPDILPNLIPYLVRV